MKTTTWPQQRPGAGISITLLAATGLIVGAAAFTAHLGSGQHAVRMRAAAAYTGDSQGACGRDSFAGHHVTVTVQHQRGRRSGAGIRPGDMVPH